DRIAVGALCERAFFAVYEVQAVKGAVKKLQPSTFPSLKRRGRMRDPKNIAKHPWFAQTGWSIRELFRPKDFAERTTPSAALLWLRDFLLMPHPPLLFKEGKTPDSNSFTAS